MDIDMPILDGFETSKEILKEVRKGNMVNIPIIALDSSSEHKDNVKYKKNGISDKLNKPLIEGDLIKTFKKYFHNRKKSMG